MHGDNFCHGKVMHLADFMLPVSEPLIVQKVREFAVTVACLDIVDQECNLSLWRRNLPNLFFIKYEKLTGVLLRV